MRHKKHISLFVIPSWYPPRGGAFFREHCLALAGADVHVHVIAAVETGLRDHPGAFLTPGHPKMNGRRKGFSEEVRITRRIPLLNQRNVARWTQKVVRMYDDHAGRYGHPNLVQVHSSMWGGLAAAQIRETWGTPYVISEHRGRFTQAVHAPGSLVRPWHLPLLQRAFDQAGHIITVSQALQKGILSICPGAAPKMSVIPNMCDTGFFVPPQDKDTGEPDDTGVFASLPRKKDTGEPDDTGVFGSLPRKKKEGQADDTGFFASHPREKDTAAKQSGGAEGFIFLCVASLEEIKGVDVLLTAFSLLKKKSGPASHLIIAGDGPLRKRLQGLCRSLHIQKEVHFTGHLDREALRRQYHRADAFVLPSRMEAFGIVLIEAMACGLPVVATRSGGPEEIVRPACGLLVAPGDPESLADGMGQMLRHHRDYDRQHIVQWTQRHYAQQVIADQYYKLYKQLLG